MDTTNRADMPTFRRYAEAEARIRAMAQGEARRTAGRLNYILYIAIEEADTDLNTPVQIALAFAVEAYLDSLQVPA